MLGSREGLNTLDDDSYGSFHKVWHVLRSFESNDWMPRMLRTENGFDELISSSGRLGRSEERIGVRALVGTSAEPDRSLPDASVPAGRCLY